MEKRVKTVHACCVSNKTESVFTTTDPTAILSRVFSLKDVRVLAYRREGPRQEIEIEQVSGEQRCRRCGARATVKDRPRVRYTDLPVYGRVMSLLWRKHRWRCPNEDCPAGTWTGRDRRIACANCRLTTRAARWATEQVGRGRTVSEVAAELGCAWHTVNDAVTAYGSALLDADRRRLSATSAIGLDETSFVRHARRRTSFVTTVCDVANHRIIDIVDSRDYVRVAAWIDQRPEGWRRGIRHATLDMSPSYRAVYDVMLPHAVQIADRFHVIALANRALDEVRRRVQQQRLGHRGRKRDPLYRIRRLLTMGEERLGDETAERLKTLLALGDPDGEVAIAHRAKERLRQYYRHQDPEQARDMLEELIALCSGTAMPPETRRLARTLSNWKPQILAFHQARLSNSVTESMNNLIKRIKRIGYGFTSFTNYRVRCLLYAGKPNWRLLNNIYP